jgi:DNA-binding MarR family transcriptional regulator
MAQQVELDNQVIIAIRRISHSVEVYSRFLWQEFGLTAPQLGTLRELQNRTEGTPTQIAEWMSISPATVAGILKRLHERKLIHRNRDREDGRSIVVRISDEGKRLAAEAPSLLRDDFRRNLSRLESWERTQILSVLQRVACMMNAEDLDHAPFLATEPPEAAAADEQAAARTGNPARRGKRRSQSSTDGNRQKSSAADVKPPQTRKKAVPTK